MLSVAMATLAHVVERQWQKDVDKVIPRKASALACGRAEAHGPRCFSEDVHIAVVAAGTAVAQWHVVALSGT